jgi:hypothetical protein
VCRNAVGAFLRLQIRRKPDSGPEIYSTRVSEAESPAPGTVLSGISIPVLYILYPAPGTRVLYQFYKLNNILSQRSHPSVMRAPVPPPLGRPSKRKKKARRARQKRKRKEEKRASAASGDSFGAAVVSAAADTPLDAGGLDAAAI